MHRETDQAIEQVADFWLEQMGDTAKITDALMTGDNRQRARVASKVIPGVTAVGPIRESVEQALR